MRSPETRRAPPIGGDNPTIDTGAIPGTGGPAFTLSRAGEATVPVLIAAPHGGRFYPPELLAAMRDPAGSTLRLEDRYIDRLALDVAAQTGAAAIVAQAPRAMIDLNRAPDDMDWTMVRGSDPAERRHSLANRRARTGLGLVPRRLSGSGDIWREPLARAELERRIARVHAPYHGAVEAALRDIRRRWGAALLLDLHSMPQLRRRYPSDMPAEFVLGDRFGASCDPMISAAAIGYLAGRERGVAHNRPYAGGYVLDRHGRPRRGVHAVQIEVCRSLYLDPRGENPSARLPVIARLLAGLVRTLADELNRLGEGEALPQAAE